MQNTRAIRIKITLLGLLMPIALLCMSGAAFSLAGYERHTDTHTQNIETQVMQETIAKSPEILPPAPAMTHEQAYDLLKILNPPFILGQYNGLLCVYNGGENPVVVLEIQTNAMRTEDLLLLEEGIECQTYEALLMLIEDYSS